MDAVLWEIEQLQSIEVSGEAAWFAAAAPWQCMAMPLCSTPIAQRPPAQQEHRPDRKGATPPGTIAASSVSKVKLAAIFRITWP